MKNLKEYLVNEEYANIKNWKEMKETLNEFVGAANLKDDSSNDVDELMDSLKEYMIEILDIKENSVKSILKQYENDIKYWFFDNMYVGEI